jgi:hypothetical protein
MYYIRDTVWGYCDYFELQLDCFVCVTFDALLLLVSSSYIPSRHTKRYLEKERRRPDDKQALNARAFAAMQSMRVVDVQHTAATRKDPSSAYICCVLLYQ